jgi:ABC-2 type transport system permease protein
VEVLFSSVSIRRFLVAKVLALGVAGLIQVLVWLISLPFLLNLASITFGGFFSGIQVPNNFLVLGVVYFILGYMLFAVIAVGIGAVAGNAHQGSQLMMIYVMMGFIPLWTASLLFNFPNNILWTVLTIFPITAPIQTMLRMGISDIPVWEILVSVSVLTFSVVFGLLFSTKVFRMYMLMYGKRPKIGEIIRTLKQSR